MSTTPNKTFRTTLELMRIHQWLKNGFVFAAPLFARQLDDGEVFAKTVAAFASFCLISSMVYVLNDIVDAENDRLHPTKKDRPIAANRYSTKSALQLIVFLFIGAVVLSFFLATPKTTLVILIYASSNVLYSFVLKHIVILDVAFIAFSFVLRILAGAAATGAVPSFWLLLCTINVSLFLGFAKRRAELIALEDSANEHRKVLEHYSHDFLDQVMSVVTTTTLICYILYTIDARTVEYFGTRGLVVTVPFVMYGIFRYLYLSYHRSEGGSPTRALLIDLPFLINNLCWGISCVIIIYWRDALGDWFPL